jgi:hypothetical protein
VSPRKRRKQEADRSPWETSGGEDLLARFDRTLRLAARRRRGRIWALPRPLSERGQKA